jgi:hypothetical protein
MDIEAFVRWAMDDARTVEERYTTELIVEQGVTHWNYRHGNYKHESIDAMMERKRQRALNPAYDPRYKEQAVRRAAEAWTDLKQWSEHCGHDSRPIRDLQVLRFLTGLEEVHLYHCEVDDVSPLADLPNLRSLHFSSSTCRDLRPLARCTKLWNLQLKLLRHWPDVRGLEDLPELESLLLHGNLLVFERAIFRKVKFASIQCEPLEARNVHDLPQLPACEFLSLGGIEALDGLEAFTKLRNFTLTTPAESFAPLAQLQNLTCLTVKDHEPLDVTPLTRVPKLQYLCFNTWNKSRLRPVAPRDLSPLVEAPALRELEVIGNPLLETEAAALQAGLPSWGDLYLRPEPQPLPPWRLLARPHVKIPREPEVARMPDEPELVDLGLRKCELNWVSRFVHRAITKKLGTSDWCEPHEDYSLHSDYAPHIISPTNRSLTIEFNSYGLIEKIPLVVATMRECLAQLRPDYRLTLWIWLKVPKRKPTKAQLALQEKLAREQDEAEFERSRQEREEYLERLYRYELKKQAGDKVKPEDFAPGERAALPPDPEELEEDDDSSDSDSDVLVKEKPDPPPSWDDDDHPLGREYNMMAHFTLTECYVLNQHAGIAEYLLRKHCDEIIQDEKKKPE